MQTKFVSVENQSHCIEAQYTSPNRTEKGGSTALHLYGDQSFLQAKGLRPGPSTAPSAGKVLRGFKHSTRFP
jgi:hypothetical protein